MESLFEKLKNLIFSKNKDKEKGVNEEELLDNIYQTILEKFNEYDEKVLPEAIKLNGHEHFRKKEIENEILELIEMNDKVLTIVSPLAKKNIGMVAASFGFEKIVSKALDNNEASTQQDSFGNNIGMLAATYKLSEELILKALDNDEASTQQNARGYNIGIWAVAKGYKEATLKALKNHKAACQYDDTRRTIGMYAAGNEWEDVVIEALKNTQAATILDYDERNLGCYAVVHKMEKAALFALDNKEIANQRCASGYNVGMFAASIGMETVVLKALDNIEASKQINNNGENIGILAARNGLEKATLKALDIKESRCQVDSRFNNIGLYAVFSKMPEAIKKAFEIKEIRNHDDSYECTMFDYMRTEKEVPEYQKYFSYYEQLTELDKTEAEKQKERFSLDNFYKLNSVTNQNNQNLKHNLDDFDMSALGNKLMVTNDNTTIDIDDFQSQG